MEMQIFIDNHMNESENASSCASSFVLFFFKEMEMNILGFLNN